MPMAKREISLRARALAMLARREHTRAEMARKLSPHSESPDELAMLLDALTARGWLSEARFAESRANTLARKFGSRKIEHDLKSRGVSAEIIEQAVGLSCDRELDRCRAVLQRKFREPPSDAAERARQLRFLQGRGYSFDVIRAAMGVEEPEE
jgi:regulatory protein